MSAGEVMDAGQAEGPGGGLSDDDREHVTHLARQIEAAAKVLDDLAYSQLEYGRPGDDQWEAVLQAITDFLGERSTRLVEDLAKAAPRKRPAP